MIKYLKVELHRAFCSVGFMVSLLLGLLLCLGYFAQHTLPFLLDGNLMQRYMDGGFPPSVFNQWIGAGFRSLEQYLLFLMLPIFAALPAATSFSADMGTGMLKNILVRCKRSHYFLSKLLAVMLSAGCSVTIPLIVNLLLTCAAVPAILPVASSATFSIFPTGMWAELFYISPWVYTLGYLAIIFVFSGLIAQTALCLSFYIKNKIAIMFSPFLLYMFSYTLFSMLEMQQFSPFCFLPPAQTTRFISFGIILVEGIILMLCSFVFFIRKGIYEDVF